jgi:phosphocarrier protein FPr/phosphocarrier protein
MLGLGLRHGAAIVVRAGGVDAEAAVSTFVELLESGMGELLPLSQPNLPAAASKPSRVPSELQGIAAVPGLAIGPAWWLKQDEMSLVQDASDPATERVALAAARDEVKSQLECEAQGDDLSAAIAEAHLAMIADPMLEETADRLIASGKTAAFAWRESIRELAAPLRASSDPRFAERLDDLLDLERRVLRALNRDASQEPRPPAGAIVVAETLYPSQLKALAESEIAGIATAAGGATSHAAIIAAGLGLPMAVGMGDRLALIGDETPLILRGDKLLVAPDRAILENMRKELKIRETRLAEARARAEELAVTADGTRIEVFANLGSVSETALAVAQGAEGCGLLRTEFLFLDRDVPPGEAEQREAYQAIADLLGERPLIVRTLDIGADKPAPWLTIDPEDNPALGLRGIRLQLARTELLETQLRALLGVRSGGKLRIMLPMVSRRSELREAKVILSRLAEETGAVEPELGIMVETPAAALLASTLAREAAFFSIGSNDLSQYALARDRTNPAVAAGLDGVDPAVLRLISETVRGASAHGRPTGVCGGLAAVAEAIPLLLGLGVSELSVPAGAIAEVKAIVRGLNLSRCRELAHEALGAPDAESVRALVLPLLEQQA